MTESRQVLDSIEIIYLCRRVLKQRTEDGPALRRKTGHHSAMFILDRITMVNC
jgi:hypothetical protein